MGKKQNQVYRRNRIWSSVMVVCMLAAFFAVSLPLSAVGTQAFAAGDVKTTAASLERLESVALNGTGFIPETLTLTPGKNTSEIGLTWYSDDTAGNGKVKFGNATVEATSGAATTGKIWHKATITGLAAGKVYVYSVSNDGIAFSREYAYKTPGAGGFTFVAVGDPQLTAGQQDSAFVFG